MDRSPNQSLDRMTRSAVSRMFRIGQPRHFLRALHGEDVELRAYNKKP
jgi:hypothetical protein